MVSDPAREQANREARARTNSSPGTRLNPSPAQSSSTSSNNSNKASSNQLGQTNTSGSSKPNKETSASPQASNTPKTSGEWIQYQRQNNLTNEQLQTAIIESQKQKRSSDNAVQRQERAIQRVSKESYEQTLLKEGTAKSLQEYQKSKGISNEQLKADILASNIKLRASEQYQSNAPVRMDMLKKQRSNLVGVASGFFEISSTVVRGAAKTIIAQKSQFFLGSYVSEKVGITQKVVRDRDVQAVALASAAVPAAIVSPLGVATLFVASQVKQTAKEPTPENFGKLAFLVVTSGLIGTTIQTMKSAATKANIPVESITTKSVSRGTERFPNVYDKEISVKTSKELIGAFENNKFQAAIGETGKGGFHASPVPISSSVTIMGKTFQIQGIANIKDYFGRTEIGKGEPKGNEQPGLFVSPAASIYFLKTSSETATTISLFPKTSKPTIQYIKANDVLESVSTSQRETGNIYLTPAVTKFLAGKGGKSEAEGQFPPGTQVEFVRLAGYTEVSGVKVPIKVYDVVQTGEAGVSKSTLDFLKEGSSSSESSKTNVALSQVSGGASSSSLPGSSSSLPGGSNGSSENGGGSSGGGSSGGGSSGGGSSGRGSGSGGGSSGGGSSGGGSSGGGSSGGGVSNIFSTKTSTSSIRSGIVYKKIYPSVIIENKKSKKKKYRVLVRSRGSFRTIGFQDTIERAFAQGKGRVENTAAASFKVVPVGFNENTSSSARRLLPSNRYYESRKEAGTFIQRRNTRITTGGEKQEITFKGIAANRFRKNKKSVFGF